MVNLPLPTEYGELTPIQRTQQNRARMGFARFWRFAPSERFSRSARDRKSRAPADLERFSAVSENRELHYLNREKPGRTTGDIELGNDTDPGNPGKDGEKKD
jgi:hypothetical protein